MDNLWKKESNKPGEAHYIDLFASYSPNKEIEESSDWFAKLCGIPRYKNNQMSTMKRQEGNDFFRLQDWPKAMDLYNESLRFAMIGSENVALAYSNRSACFFRMKMYDETLADIKLAKNANINERLLPKLEQRQQQCLQLMVAVQKPVRREFKLSYKANKNFPCMADVLEIKYNQVYGRHLVAKCDIPVGQIVLVEKDFIGTRDNDDTLCSTCFQKRANFIACAQCPDALFCDTDCMNENFLHKWACGLSWSQFHFENKFCIQSILLAIDIFPNIERLIQFVERVSTEDPETLPVSIQDQKSNYHFFMKLKTPPNDNTYTSFSRTDYFYLYYKCLISIPKVSALFDCKEKKRFLMHLVAQHYLIIKTNASLGENWCKSLNNVFSMTNHSCAPNLNSYCIGDKCVCETIRYVKKGEQLCISYLELSNTVGTEGRQKELMAFRNFVCECEKCESNNTDNNYHLLFDPSFKFVFENQHDEREYLTMVEKCREFLNKFGHLKWSTEIEFMSHRYADLILKLYVLPLK